MKTIRSGMIILGVSLGVPPSGHAEDIGAIVAALNDPAVECQYVKQLQEESKTATTLLNENTTALDAVTSRIEKQSFINPNDVRRGKELSTRSRALRIIANQKLNDYLTALTAVQAKRGTQGPCPAGTRPRATGQENDPAQSPVAPPQTQIQTGSLKARLHELKKLRSQNLITPEEYYQKRAKLLGGF